MIDASRKEIVFNKPYESFYILCEYSHKPFYTHTFFIRTLDRGIDFLS